MASIRKRRNKFNVVYYYTNDQGERKQKWEPFDTEEEAKTRKAEIEGNTAEWFCKCKPLSR